MTYFVTSDIHGFYTIFKKALKKAKFDINNKDHVLIICGDLFDRGEEETLLTNNFTCKMAEVYRRELRDHIIEVVKKYY